MTYCIKCGFRNEATFRFCIRCSAPLVAPVADSAVSAQTEPFARPANVSGPSSGSTKAPPSHISFNTENWLAKNKKLLFIFSAAICLFWIINRFFFQPHPDPEGKAVAHTTNLYEQQKTPVVTPSIPPPSKNETQQSETPGRDLSQTNPADDADTSEHALTDDFIKQRISNLYEEENNIGSSEEAISKIMSYYKFPMLRYYDEKNVPAGALFKIYANSYLKSLSYHKVDSFQDKITISRQPDGDVKAIVGCRFEFSTSQTPDTKRSRTVYNVYVLDKDGKIKSVYQLL